MRTPGQVLHSLDNLIADLMRSGLGGYAKRLRKTRTQIANLLPAPCDCGECAECVRIVKQRPAKRSARRGAGSNGSRPHRVALAIDTAHSNVVPAAPAVGSLKGGALLSARPCFENLFA
jgi:hypothetical protein